MSYRWIVYHELAFLNYRLNQVNQIGTVMAMQAGWGFMTRHHRSLIRLICSLQVCWNSRLEINYGPKVKHILVRVKVVSEGEGLQQIVNGPKCAPCLCTLFGTVLSEESVVVPFQVDNWVPNNYFIFQNPLRQFKLQFSKTSARYYRKKL